MRRLLPFLWAHPLVWLVPLAFFAALVGLIALEVAETPDAPFLYDL